jgi:hypothetical protein
MTAPETTTTTITTFADRFCFDEAELAAVAVLSRYSGRTLDAYRHDLRMFFQWASDHNLHSGTVPRACGRRGNSRSVRPPLLASESARVRPAPVASQGLLVYIVRHGLTFGLGDEVVKVSVRQG